MFLLLTFIIIFRYVYRHKILNISTIKAVGIVYLFLFFLAFGTKATAELNIKSWKQENTINKAGQRISVLMELKAEKLEKNYYYDSWGYIFDKSSSVELIKATVLNGKGKSVSFNDNSLQFTFENLFNNQSVFIYFEYQIKDNRVDNSIEYIRNEFIQIPYFVAGAKGELKVNVPDIYDIYSLNYSLKQQENSNHYKWSGTVSKKGFLERIDLTRKKAKWEITTRVVFNSNSDINSANIKIPLLYVGGNNSIIEYSIYNNQINFFDNQKITKDDRYIMAKYDNLNSREGFIEIHTLLENNYNNFFWVNDIDLNLASSVEQEQEEILSTLANKIINEDKRDLPIYVKIGEWVNKNISYDLNYIGKRLTATEILNQKKGVCEHYSILYENLLKSIGILAVSISGVAYNRDKKSFEPHAWTLVRYNENWLPMDATWGIFSGKLPISHIFSYNSLNEKYSVNTIKKVSNNSRTVDNKVTISIETNVDFVEF